jgi:hypothetical protein
MPLSDDNSTTPADGVPLSNDNSGTPADDVSVSDDKSSTHGEGWSRIQAACTHIGCNEIKFRRETSRRGTEALGY